MQSKKNSKSSFLFYFIYFKYHFLRTEYSKGKSVAPHVVNQVQKLKKQT